MRIIWNEKENAFQVEFSEKHWSSDLEYAKTSGFKTQGPPSWSWLSRNILPVNKLRKNPPLSGLTITELALEKYNFLEKKIAEKTALKKQAEQILKETDQSQSWEEYFDEELGFMCIVVKSKKSDFTWIPPMHSAPEAHCIICGDGLYLMDYQDVCMWCDTQQRGT